MNKLGNQTNLDDTATSNVAACLTDPRSDIATCLAINEETKNQSEQSGTIGEVEDDGAWCNICKGFPLGD